MADGKPLSRYNSAVARRIAVKFCMMTHFDPLKPSGQNLITEVRGLYSQSDSAGDRTGTVRMPIGVHIGTTWRIRLNRPCTTAMRPYVKLL